MTEDEELLMLREMVEKQKQTLLEKDEIIRKKDIRIENLTQALLHARKKILGASSEATQMSLFDNVQELVGELFSEQKKVAVKSHKRTPRKAGVREEMLETLPKEIEEYIIDLEEACDICGGRLKVIG